MIKGFVEAPLHFAGFRAGVASAHLFAPGSSQKVAFRLLLVSLLMRVRVLSKIFLMSDSLVKAALTLTLGALLAHLHLFKNLHHLSLLSPVV